MGLKILQTVAQAAKAPRIVSGPKYINTSFIDFKQVALYAGHGGDGGIAFDRTALVPLGPPSGGNGGVGGSIYIVASRSVTALNGVRQRYAALKGVDGSNANLHGRNAKDIEIIVPLGTLIREVRMDDCVENNQEESGAESSPEQEDANEADLENSTFMHKVHVDEVAVKEHLNDMDYVFVDEKAAAREKYLEEEADAVRFQDKMEKTLVHFKFRHGYRPQEDRLDMLLERVPLQEPVQPLFTMDLLEHGQRQLVVKGGHGGLGNPHFSSPLIRGPAVAGRGRLGQKMFVELELKTLADAGLVGLPNAGKSTLLKAVSNAHPRIAPYPFTTLNPYVGLIEFPDFYTMTLADMPGIIKGAHQNFGLGHRFLRHIERNHLLVYVIDLSAVAPWDDLATLQNELEMYTPGLTSRPSIVVANKADVPVVSPANLEILKASTSLPIVPISARDEKNIHVLTALMRRMLDSIKTKATGA